MTVPTVAITSADRYVQKGLTKEAACAIISVLWVESGLNPGPQPSTSQTDHGGILYGSGAMGVASWNGSRQADLGNFAARKGLSAWALNTQLDFVLTECANSYKTVWDYIQNGKSYSTIIPPFVREYERPKNPEQEIERAMTFARELYPHISAAQIPPQLPSPQIPTIPPVSTTMPQEMLIQLGIQLAVGVFEGLMNSLTKQMQQGGVAAPSIPTAPAMPQFDPQDFAKILAQELAQVLHPTQPKV